jgi:sensor histidine kinase YesM
MTIPAPIRSMQNPLPSLSRRWSSWFAESSPRMGDVERDQMRRFLRMWSGKRGWVQFGLVIVWNTLVAVGIAHWTGKLSFLEAMSIVNLFVFSLAGVVFGAWFGFRRYARKFMRTLVLMMMFAIGGAFLGAGSSGWLHGEGLVEFMRTNWMPVLAAGAITGFALAALSALIAHLRNREYVSLAERLRVESRQEQLSRQIAETRLHLLQAQIEPHFLFNTLASAQQLASAKAPEAAQLLSHLTRFLRAAMPRLRDGDATLGQEIDMINAYLAIMQARLGDRLRYSVDVDPALHPLQFPSLMLMTLVENAIKHGIEPLKEGGEVTVAVSRVDNRLIASVADTGMGLSDVIGTGVGLDNIRERLRVRYGASGSLELFANEPRGFAARLEMPCPT